MRLSQRNSICALSIAGANSAGATMHRYHKDNFTARIKKYICSDSEDGRDAVQSQRQPGHRRLLGGRPPALGSLPTAAGHAQHASTQSGAIQPLTSSKSSSERSTLIKRVMRSTGSDLEQLLGMVPSVQLPGVSAVWSTLHHSEVPCSKCENTSTECLILVTTLQGPAPGQQWCNQRGIHAAPHEAQLRPPTTSTSMMNLTCQLIYASDCGMADSLLELPFL
jgi:hypothetical protein